MHPVKVSCVSYINSAPYIYGLRKLESSGVIILSLDNPSECAAKLRLGSVDIGLVPVAAIASIKNATYITDWCIGADGPVKSVTLLSEVPLREIKSILLDFQSVSSNILTRVLAANFWNINPEFCESQNGLEQEISGSRAGVIIGDRSLQQQHKFKYVYDLAEEWKKFTGLPFVFARWVSTKNLSSEFALQFNEALSFGIQHMDDVIVSLKALPEYQPGTDSYLLNNLSYHFDAAKKRGMELYLEYAASLTESEVRELQ
ncbi:MAG: menaquinone biosynthesis protein [Bacteroidota bacterium]|nr:menaquinone biosynthesis protein [Bacteroidota bacterium]